MGTDWEKVRRDYVVSDLGVEELAAKWKISAEAIKKRRTRDKWVEARDTYRRELSLRAEKIVAERSAGAEADRLMKINSCCDALLAQIEKSIAEQGAVTIAKQRIEATKDGKKTITTKAKRVKARVPADPADLRDLATSLKALRDTTRPTDDGGDRTVVVEWGSKEIEEAGG